MASLTLTTTQHATLSGTTADTVTLAAGTTGPKGIEILNRSSTATLYVRADGTTAVADAEGTTAVLAGQAIILEGVVAPISIVGTSNPYSVHIVGRGIG